MLVEKLEMFGNGPVEVTNSKDIIFRKIQLLAEFELLLIISYFGS